MTRGIIFYLIYASGLNALFKFFLRNRLILLGYHGVYGSKDSNKLAGLLYPGLAVNKESFDEQLAYLSQKKYTFLNFSDLSRIVERRECPTRPVIVYFDDGFLDVYANAYPILKKYGAKAVMFLTSDFIDQKDASPMIKKNAALKNIALDFKKTPVYLSWQQAGEMSDIFEFGAHGKTHRKLNLLSENELQDEVSVSRDKIIQNLGKPPMAFSYPHGRFNDEAETFIRKSGFKFTVSTRYGFNSLNKLYKPLSKIVIGPGDNLISFKAKLGFYYPVRNFILSLIGRNQSA